MMETPIDLNRWVSDNNPPSHLQYDKGWWDYIEVVRRICWKFGIEEVEVIGTYRMNTPPPEELLEMPIFRLRVDGLEFIVKYDFGIVPEAWTVSVISPGRLPHPVFGLFDPSASLRPDAARGMAPDWIYPPCGESPGRFSCEVSDEWDLAALIRVMLDPEPVRPDWWNAP